MFTAFTPLSAKIIQKLERCSRATAFRRLQEIKTHFNITAVKIKHLADFWLVDAGDILSQLYSK